MDLLKCLDSDAFPWVLVPSTQKEVYIEFLEVGHCSQESQVLMETVPSTTKSFLTHQHVTDFLEDSRKQEGKSKASAKFTCQSR